MFIVEYVEKKLLKSQGKAELTMCPGAHRIALCHSVCRSVQARVVLHAVTVWMAQDSRHVGAGFHEPSPGSMTLFLGKPGLVPSCEESAGTLGRPSLPGLPCVHRAVPA